MGKIEKIGNFINKYMGIIILLALLFVLLGTTLIAAFRDNKPQEITFNVVGVAESANATTLVQIHFECIKYCVSHVSDYNPRRLCFEQCEKLGKVKPCDCEQWASANPDAPCTKCKVE